ncbi:hypothetical protein [Streptomyces sp. 8N706]|uniref:hypothetical protein n=1 Tax=Streptomyces sp. 8N706 TaxID=3457416 RepID=UPI003FCFE76F
MRRAWIVGTAAVVALTAGVGCSSRSDDKPAAALPPKSPAPAPARPSPQPSPRACEDGTYRWFNISQRSTLTDLSPAKSYRKGQQVSTERNKELARYTPSVTTRGPVLPSQAVIHALARHLKAGDGLAADGSNGSPATSRDDRSATGSWPAEKAGRYLTSRSIKLIEADFSYACRGGGRGDEITSGHVLTWKAGADLDIVACDRKPERKRPAGVREAARLGCAKDDPPRS